MASLVPPDPPLRDEVVALRRLERTDAAALVAICQDPEIPRWTLAPSPYGEADAHRFLALVGLRRLELRAQVGNAAAGG